MINFLAAARLSGALATLLGWCAPAIRWLATLAFPIYLCHMPLLQLFSTYRIAAPGSPAQYAWLFGPSLAIMIAVAGLSERLRHGLRSKLEAVWLRTATTP